MPASLNIPAEAPPSSNRDLRQKVTDYTALSVDTVLLCVVGAASLRLAEALAACLEAERSLRGRWVKYTTLAGMVCWIDGNDVWMRGSLARLAHGTNARAASPDDIARALVHIAKELGVLLSVVLSARVYRLDIVANLLTSRSPVDYLRALVHVPYAARVPRSPTSIEFANKTRELAFYDKAAEISANGGTVPSALAGRHVLRYELRLLKDVRDVFGRIVTADTLTQPAFHAELAQLWGKRYRTVETEPVVELGEPSTVPALVRSLARIGAVCAGQARVLEAIDALPAKGVTSSDMRGKQRRRVRDLMADAEYASTSDLVAELTGLIEATAAIDAAVGAASL